ncbi:MAG: DUF4412 domain-containing protein [Bacteroidia bacterium]
MNIRNLTTTLFIAAIGFNSTALKAQDKISEGKAVFTLEFPTEGMDEQYKAMMPTESTIYFKGSKSRSETTMAMMNMVSITDSKEKTMITLMDMMGKKTAMKTDLDKAVGKAKTDDYKIETTTETMKIAGYECTKVIATNKDGDKVELWVTKDIQAQNSGSILFKGLEGFPMKYEVAVPNMEGKMKMECKSITAEKVSDDKFTIPEGYEIKTQEELKKEYGGK